LLSYGDNSEKAMKLTAFETGKEKGVINENKN